MKMTASRTFRSVVRIPVLLRKVGKGIDSRNKTSSGRGNNRFTAIFHVPIFCCVGMTNVPDVMFFGAESNGKP